MNRMRIVFVAFLATISARWLLAARPVAFAPWPCIALTCPRAAARPASRRHDAAKACRMSKP